MSDLESVLTSESLKKYRETGSVLTELIYDECDSFDIVEVYEFASVYLGKNDHILCAGTYTDPSLQELDVIEFNNHYGFGTNEVCKESSLYDEKRPTGIKCYKINMRGTCFLIDFFKAIFSLSVIELRITQVETYLKRLADSFFRQRGKNGQCA
ncbi:MAG: hypothetical protein QXU18_15100 [Thermoplasmatales archaeon]